MTTAIIADDEAPSRSRLKRHLLDFPDIRIIGEARDGQEALDLVRSLSPDLLFLDIQMPVMNGFKVLESLPEPPAIVFISAFDEYALQAFEVNAVDYLLKPYSPERFRTAVSRVLSLLDNRAFWSDHVAGLLSSIRGKGDYLTRISFRDGHFFRVMDLLVVDYFKIEEGLVYLYSDQERYQIDFTLSQLEERIDPDQFLRVHRNALANMDRIHRVLPWGQNRIVLEYGVSGNLQVSRDKTAVVRQHLGMK